MENFSSGATGWCVVVGVLWMECAGDGGTGGGVWVAGLAHVAGTAGTGRRVRPAAAGRRRVRALSAGGALARAARTVGPRAGLRTTDTRRACAEVVGAVLRAGGSGGRGRAAALRAIDRAPALIAETIEDNPDFRRGDAAAVGGEDLRCLEEAGGLLAAARGVEDVDERAASLRDDARRAIRMTPQVPHEHGTIPQACIIKRDGARSKSKVQNSRVPVGYYRGGMRQP